ncbi:MAG TPA: hypothetical protein PKE12_02925 [Kiritimatiellia bacterium]|nr:hypothetical protein [Kiritimatiellia bacterium]
MLQAATASLTQCPFSTRAYLRGLSHVGEPVEHPSAPLAILRRPIANTNLYDGAGPWPYRWMADETDADLLRDGFRDMVTLTVVTHPGWTPPAGRPEYRLLKQHYVYDSARPAPALSRRARMRLHRAESRGSFDVLTDAAARLEIIPLYAALARRRSLADGLFDLPAEHFRGIADLPHAVFYRVADGNATGAMACGVVLGEFLQILHFVTTENGLSWNASYLLMYAMQQEARKNGWRLLTGGMPATGSPGLHAFKSKWSNAFLPVHLLCLVNDQAAYARLAAQRAHATSYFPAYRDES